MGLSHGSRTEKTVVTKTWNHPKPSKTTQNYPKPSKTTYNHQQNHPKPSTKYPIRPVCVMFRDQYTCVAVCVMLRDYHVNKSCVEFSPSRYRVYLAMKNFSLKLSGKVKACSRAENKPADILLKLKPDAK